jgi:Na+-translocating ferredoxin:NAD+ oxidoreductase RnfC subunit
MDKNENMRYDICIECGFLPWILKEVKKMAFSFFGGVHPKENKFYACDVPIQEFPEPDILVVPMSQHIGASCTPLVKKGDLVKKGQKIKVKMARNGGFAAMLSAE